MKHVRIILGSALIGGSAVAGWWTLAAQSGLRRSGHTLSVSNDAEMSAAIAAAKPGDEIIVAPGTYGPIKITRDINGTAAAPILLRSATPRGAKIVQTNNGVAAITMPGSKHWIIDGFHTVGGRNGIQASMNGRDADDYTPDRMIDDITIRNNVIDHVFDDGIKTGGGRNVHIINNHSNGGRGQGVDVDAIIKFEVTGNTVTCNNGRGGIIAKMGATDGRIDGNTVSDCAQGIKAGDTSDSAQPKKSGAAFFPGSTYEVARITISHNVISSQGAPILFIGAKDSAEFANQLTKAGIKGPLVVVKESPGFTRHPTWPSVGIRTSSAPADRVELRAGSARAN